MMEIVILVLIAAALFFALRYIKNHGSSCGGNCAACGMDCKKRESSDKR